MIQEAATISNEPTSREIYIGNVNAELARNVITTIRAINREDKEKEAKIKDYVRKPIEIIVNSYGGSCYNGFGIIAAIESSETPVETVCVGSAMSMGLAIYLAAPVRTAHPHDTFMYHAVSDLAWGQLEEHKRNLEELERLQGQYDRYVVSKTRIPQEELDDHKSRVNNWYISGCDAIRYGIATRMIGSMSTVELEDPELIKDNEEEQKEDTAPEPPRKIKKKPEWAK